MSSHLGKMNPLSKNNKKVVRNELDLFQMFQIYRKMRRQIWELSTEEKGLKIQKLFENKTL